MTRKSKAKFLTQSEKSRMILNHERERCRKLELQVAELLIDKARLYKELQENKIKDLLLKKTKLQEHVNNQRQAHKEWVSALRASHAIKNDEWGFDPDTGEINPDPNQS